jgi:hypothetical protein
VRYDGVVTSSTRAACGKDPGFSPSAILEAAARANRYSAAELHGLAFEDGPPDPGQLSRRWHAMLAAAREIVGALPPDDVGRAVLAADGGLFGGDLGALGAALVAGQLIFHQGSIRGAMPRLV